MDNIMTLREVGNHPNLFYFHTDWWQARLRAVEGIDSTKLTERDRASLKLIYEKDPEFKVRVEAKKALDGKETASMVRRRLRKQLVELGDKDSVGYRCEAPADKRLEALQNLKLPLSQTQKKDLSDIFYHDEDPAIQAEVRKILAGGIPSNLAMPENPKVLNSIGSHPDFNYDCTKPWTDRANALKFIRLDDVNGLNADNLRLISEKDPHPEVRRAAENMYKGYLDREADPEGREGKLK